MTHWLVQHALQHVWCNPEQDRQYIFKPARLTPAIGARVRYNVHKQWIALPTVADSYHLFQIGYCPDEIIDVFRTHDTQWTDLTTWINQTAVYVEMYTDDGRQLPRSSVYYRWTEDDNLILAVKVLSALGTVYSKPLYFRVYQNAFYSSARYDDTHPPLYVDSLICSHPNDILEFQQAYDRWAALPGLTTAYINGEWAPRLTLATMPLGSCVEYVYDHSVLQTVTFRLQDIVSFDSTLDNQRKYLLHPPKGPVAHIRYHDDIDLYVIDDSALHAKKGVYLHRNLPASVRMLTHWDYSVSVNTVQYFVREMQQRYGMDGIRLDDLTLRLHIRESGYARPLVFETNRIHELYRLTDTEIVTAMLGSDGSVPYWHAGHLEQSAYTAIMQNLPSQITPALVESAYGYRALSQLIAQTPQQVTAGTVYGTVVLPMGLHHNSTVYEYTEAGEWLGSYTHNSGYHYTARHTQTAFVEALYGTGSYAPWTEYGIDKVAVPANGHYRVYLGRRTDDGWTGPWEDITGGNDYTVMDGHAVWTGDRPNQVLCVRSDQTFLMYDVAFVPIDGTLRFSLSALENRGDGFKNHTLLVPYGNIDLFLNGRSLIQELDYFVNFPDVVIVNKAYLTPNPNTHDQHIHVRCSGFTTRDGHMHPVADIGFVMHGALSYNRRYDLRDDAVQRIVVDGRVMLHDTVRFAEELTVRDPIAVSNGRPYIIEEVMVPMEPLTGKDTYQLHDQAVAVDRAISQYLTLKYPQADLGIAAIPERYAVVSPFLCKIIFQLYNEELPTVELSGEMTDTEVLAVCRRYLDWLKFDPIKAAQPPDSRFVEIHPVNVEHTIPLNLYQYRFIHQVVRLYCPNKVDLAPFITLDPHRSLP